MKKGPEAESDYATRIINDPIKLNERRLRILHELRNIKSYSDDIPEEEIKSDSDYQHYKCRMGSFINVRNWLDWINAFHLAPQLAPLIEAFFTHCHYKAHTIDYSISPPGPERITALEIAYMNQLLDTFIEALSKPDEE